MSSAPQNRSVAAVAMVNVSAEEQRILKDCFREFRVEIEAVSPKPDELQRRRFDAFVVRLAGAEPYLKALRSGSVNRRTMVYGIGTPDEALQLGQYGVNCVLPEPLTDEAAARVIKDTYLLLVGQLRRFVRLPLATAVTIVRGAEVVTALTREISAGGLSVQSALRFGVSDDVTLSFELPSVDKLTIPAIVCWRTEHDQCTGFQFQSSNDRLRLKSWIDDYLDLQGQ